MVRGRGRRVLVTGGEGFIGSHLVERLVHDGAEVRTLGPFNRSAGAGSIRRCTATCGFLPGDVRDAGRVPRRWTGARVVFHLAALIGIPYSYVALESYVQVNVEGTSNVALACRSAGVSKLVHTSTSETYGSALRVPIDEDHPLQPQSPYSASKIGADMMALSYWHAFELPVAVVAVQHLGPRQSTRAVIPTILAQLHGGATEIRLGATAPTRDFNYVEDTVGGFLAVADCDRAVGVGGEHRLGTGDRHRRPGAAPDRSITGSSARWWSTPTRCGRRAARSTACCATTPAPATGPAGRRRSPSRRASAHLGLGEGVPPPPRHRGLRSEAPLCLVGPGGGVG